MAVAPSKRSRQLAQLLLEALHDSKVLSEDELKTMVADSHGDLNVGDVADVLEKGTSFGAFRKIRGKYQLGSVVMAPCGTTGRWRGRRGRSPSPANRRRRARRTAKRGVGSRRGRTPARRRRRRTTPGRKRSRADVGGALNDSGDAAQNVE